MEAHREIVIRGKASHSATLSGCVKKRAMLGVGPGSIVLCKTFATPPHVAQIPGLHSGGMLMLAIGIGVNVAAFGFFNLIFLKPLPVRDPDTLVRLEPRSPHGYASYMAYPEMDFVREYSKTLSAVLASRGTRLRIEGEEKPISTALCHVQLLLELGAMPRSGDFSIRALTSDQR